MPRYVLAEDVVVADTIEALWLKVADPGATEADVLSAMASEGMATMRVLVIGATGWIGGAVTDAFRETGGRISGLVRSTDAAARLRAGGVEPVLGDLADAESLVDSVRNADAVVYAASAPAIVTDAAIDALIDNLAGSERPLVFVSGSSVYDDTGFAGPVDETAPLRSSPSVEDLVGRESKVREASTRGVRGVVVRGAGILYGRGGGATPEFWLDDARQAGCARYLGNGEQRWSCLHVDDLADLVVRAVERAEAGSLFNAAAEALPLRDAAGIIAQAIEAPGGAVGILQSAVADEWGPFWSTILAQNLWLLAARAGQDLGWRPTRLRFADDMLHGSYQPTAS